MNFYLQAQSCPWIPDCISNCLPNISILTSNGNDDPSLPSHPKTGSFLSFPHFSKWCHCPLAVQVPSIVLILEPFLSLLLHRQTHQSTYVTAVHVNGRNWSILGRKIKQGVAMECAKREGRLAVLFVNRGQEWTLWESDIKAKTFLKYREAQAPVGSEEKAFQQREEWACRSWGAQETPCLEGEQQVLSTRSWLRSYDGRHGPDYEGSCQTGQA